MKRFIILLCGSWLVAACQVYPAHARAAVVGVNWFGGKPDASTTAAQEQKLAAMQAAGVTVVRCGLDDNAKGFAFLKLAKSHGISVVWIIDPAYKSSAPAATAAPAIISWRDPGLSQIDQDGTTAKFGAILKTLDSDQIKLAGIEIGNEFNWVSNGDFPIPGDGRVLTYQDLQTDPIGRKIAQGYLVYLQALSNIRTQRDASSVNHDIPLITGGTAGWPPGKIPPVSGTLLDAVSTDATLKFFKAHGADKIVDAYGIHTYPTGKDPNSVSGNNLRQKDFLQNEMAACGVGGGKPCWLTEWGFKIASPACPVDDSDRLALVTNFRNQTLEPVIRDGRLTGAIFFDWGGEVKGKEDDAGIVRCGAVTPSGLRAIASFQAPRTK